ncbi:MAG: hypothetical protein COU22_01485 [Candidatus Komeilibacteria bacterium CG10_big_fil_rev_8_21_14_0_10_41_13]|uniref:Methyltransferase domain-containing protein n=1 Tax=Candidatus Komeilibacteria bacterium CG10_big_fil_rev_8_21_14_0_10_41_13 TaxID=1974476 RepID=A0A2M6WCN0_9BACT|nr:MAG: hypothetical protein COU22_01485 [Candidatus Komeilibacteria bacterium CG10_big_fil_rev_8_21_14_0_10_41_13]
MAIYDKIAAAYTDPDRTNHPQRIYQIYYSWLKEIGDARGLRVLDMACGHGHSSRLLAEQGVQVTAFDESIKMIRIAQEIESQQPSGIEYIKARGQEIQQFSPTPFDLVTAGYFFHYARTPAELSAFVENAALNLKAGGRLVAININPLSPVCNYIPGATGFAKWIDQPWQNGSRIKVTVYGASRKRLTSFINYHWQKEVYEQHLSQFGFKDIRWTDLTISPEGLELKFNWQKVMDYKIICILSAVKN